MRRSALRVLYAVDTSIPSRRANTVQSLRMVDALEAAGVSVILCARSITASRSEIERYYDVKVPAVVRSSGASTGRGSSWRFAGFVAKRARSEPCDAVHTRSEKAALAVLLTSRRPVLLELHQPLRTLLIRKRARWGGRLRMTALSSSLREEICRQTQLRVDEIALLRSAASPSRSPRGFAPPVQTQRGDRALRVGYAGHLYTGKGMEIVGPTAERCPEAEFVVAGGEPTDIAYWQGRLANLPNVRFVGHMSPAEVRQLLASLDIALLPTQEVVRPAGSLEADIGQWTSPLKAFEYMAAGLAIVASDIPVHREILEDGRTALFCRPDDPDAWADAVRRLTLEHSLRSEIGSNAMKQQQREHSWADCAADLVALVQRLTD